ncbi:MAG TPA: hypothetical protein VMG10_26650 [Gemmataceae bacterium]|nr:hypothetical protein [Gemmataceae bacterium]
MHKSSTARGFRLGVLMLLLSAALGCGGGRAGKIKTYPVRGSVAYKGGSRLDGGSLHFQSLRDPTLTVAGEIKPDGTFSLHTLVDKEKLSGATEGEYRVTVVPPLPADHTIAVVQPVVLGKTYQVEAKENQLTIEVDPPRQRF